MNKDIRRKGKHEKNPKKETISFSDTVYFVILVYILSPLNHTAHTAAARRVSASLLLPVSSQRRILLEEEEEMEGGVSFWQALTLSSILGWVVASSWFDLTKRIRALAQPWVTRRVLADTPSILWLQSMRHGFLDCIFSVLSCLVSVPFYTGFLPIVYWSGHRKLARQMTLLMAFCDYIGNSIKDVVSAPRPSCPPVTRVITTNDEKGNAMEYGLPSSHCLNTEYCLI